MLTMTEGTEETNLKNYFKSYVYEFLELSKISLFLKKMS